MSNGVCKPHVCSLVVAALMVSLSACSTLQRMARETPVSTPDAEAPAGPSAATGAAALPPVRSTAASRLPPIARESPDLVQPAGLPPVNADPNTMVAHFINVGQGDAILLEFSCAAMLIDAGGETTTRDLGRDRLRDYLRAFFIRRADLARMLSLVVLSHPHADHTDGVKELLSPELNLTILNVVDNSWTKSGSGKSGQRALEQYASSTPEVGYRGIAQSQIKTVSGVTDEVIDPINCGEGGAGVDPEISVLWGLADIDAGWTKNQNNSSVVMRVSFGQASFLFLGDMEEEALSAMLESYSADLSAFNVDVLKVAHHGSKNGTTAELVAATTPQIAVIQSGDNSPIDEKFNAFVYAHPNRAAIELLLDPANGVSMVRPPMQVRVGIKGKGFGANSPPPVFTTMPLRKAIYSNTWDENIAVIARSDGTLSIETGF